MKIISYITSYNREESLKRIVSEHIKHNIDFIIVDDGSYFINNEYWEQFNIMKYDRYGKIKHIHKFNDIFEHFNNSNYDSIIVLPDDVYNVDFDYIKMIAEVNKNEEYIFNLLTDHRKTCWNTIQPIYLEQNIERVYFTDCIFLTNKKTISFFNNMTLPKKWFDTENKSSGVGYTMSKIANINDIAIYRRVTSICTHSDEISVMHPEERKNNPLLSVDHIYVLITAYETHEYIEKCLDSVANQTIDCKIILGIDGCEKTLEKVKTIQYKYNNLEVYYFNENKGANITFNSLSEFVPNNSLIVKFDSDDIMLPHDIYDIYSNMSNIEIYEANQFKNKQKTINKNVIKIEKEKLKIICNIATMDSRSESLKETILSLNAQSILPDEINVYNNDKEDIDYTDNAKFKFLNNYDEPVYYFTMDDDIIYGEDYIEKTIRNIEENKCIITYHGRVLSNVFENYYSDHYSFSCKKNHGFRSVIDVPGTGVTAFRTDYFNPIDIYKHKYHRMSDCLIGLEAIKNNKTILFISDEDKPHIYFSALDQEFSCFDNEINDTTRQNEICKQIYEIKLGLNI